MTSPSSMPAAFDAAAVCQPRTVAVIERELLGLHQDAVFDERRIAEFSAIRDRLASEGRHPEAASYGHQLRTMIECHGMRQKRIAALNAEVEEIETTPRVPAHVLMAAE